MNRGRSPFPACCEGENLTGVIADARLLYAGHAFAPFAADGAIHPERPANISKLLIWIVPLGGEPEHLPREPSSYLDNPSRSSQGRDDQNRP